MCIAVSKVPLLREFTDMTDVSNVVPLPVRSSDHLYLVEASVSTDLLTVEATVHAAHLEKPIPLPSPCHLGSDGQPHLTSYSVQVRPLGMLGGVNPSACRERYRVGPPLHRAYILTMS